MAGNDVELGCGLIGIGRTWGYRETAIPAEEAAVAFLDAAWSEGIRYYDTAPAYGSSELRLGKWIGALSTEQRGVITVATKFGEVWLDPNNQSAVDHSYEGLSASLDQSLARLGKIDILQLHKTNPTVLGSGDLARAWAYARERGITRFGASVSDIESAEMVCEDPNYEVIQLPFNVQNTQFEQVIAKATQSGKKVVINRPFNMGQAVETDKARTSQEIGQEAFSFILDHAFDGIILTGTKSVEHLRENVATFAAARAAAA